VPVAYDDTGGAYPSPTLKLPKPPAAPDYGGMAGLLNTPVPMPGAGTLTNTPTDWGAVGGAAGINPNGQYAPPYQPPTGPPEPGPGPGPAPEPGPPPGIGPPPAYYPPGYNFDPGVVAQQATQAAWAREAARNAIIGFGDPALAGMAGFGMDPQDAAFAQQNYLSGNATLARINKAHEHRQRAVINRLASHGILNSGDLGYLSGEEGQQYGNEQSDARHS
jgi:hypothetical protein